MTTSWNIGKKSFVVQPGLINHADRLPNEVSCIVARLWAKYELKCV